MGNRNVMRVSRRRKAFQQESQPIHFFLLQLPEAFRSLVIEIPPEDFQVCPNLPCTRFAMTLRWLRMRGSCEAWIFWLLFAIAVSNGRGDSPPSDAKPQAIREGEIAKQIDAALVK